MLCFYIYSETCMRELTSYISLYNEPPFQRTPLLTLDYVFEIRTVVKRLKKINQYV